jgi:hypothetical protein
MKTEVRVARHLNQGPCKRPAPRESDSHLPAWRLAAIPPWTAAFASHRLLVRVCPFRDGVPLRVVCAHWPVCPGLTAPISGEVSAGFTLATLARSHRTISDVPRAFRSYHSLLRSPRKVGPVNLTRYRVGPLSASNGISDSPFCLPFPFLNLRRCNRGAKR